MTPRRAVFSLVLMLVLAGCVQLTPKGERDARGSDESGSSVLDEEDKEAAYWVARETRGDWGKTEWSFFAADWYETGGGCPDGESLEAFDVENPFDVENAREDVVVRFPSPGCWIEGRIHLEENMSMLKAWMHFPVNENGTQSGWFATYLDGERRGGMGGGRPGNWVGIGFAMDLPAGEYDLKIVSEQEPGDAAFFHRVVAAPETDPVLVVDGSDF